MTTVSEMLRDLEADDVRAAAKKLCAMSRMDRLALYMRAVRLSFIARKKSAFNRADLLAYSGSVTTRSVR